MSAAAHIYLAIVFIGLGIALMQHGEAMTGTYSFWTRLLATAIGCGLLYWGGFFAKVAA
jgi:hypothetical protein